MTHSAGVFLYSVFDTSWTTCSCNSLQSVQKAHKKLPHFSVILWLQSEESMMLPQQVENCYAGSSRLPLPCFAASQAGSRSGSDILLFPAHARQPPGGGQTTNNLPHLCTEFSYWTAPALFLFHGAVHFLRGNYRPGLDNRAGCGIITHVPAGNGRAQSEICGYGGIGRRVRFRF